MRGLKASFVILGITVIACIAMLSSGYRRVNTFSTVDVQQPDIVTGTGTFSGNAYYLFADNQGIYYVNYNGRNRVELFDIKKQASSYYLSPVKSNHKINLMSKSGDNVLWEEDSEHLREDGDKDFIYDWDIYLKKDNRIIKVDGGNRPGESQDVDESAPPKVLSVYGNYLVYKTYDKVPGTNSTGIVLKLYDMENDKIRSIFSIMDIKNTSVSDPCIYKDYVVWGAGKAQQENGNNKENGDIYIYNIKTNSYSKFIEGDNLSNPMIWEDYIICSSRGDGGASIVLINIKDGSRKSIASTDSSLSPYKEVYEYSMGEGYITWNNSYIDCVSVHDIKNNKTYELDKSVPDNDTEDSLLNIRIYGKMLLYTEHKFKKLGSSTVSETGKYFILK